MRVGAGHHEMRDPMRQRVGLARTRPRNDQQRARIGPLAHAMLDRRALVGIELFQVGGHCESRLASGSTTNHVSCFVRKWSMCGCSTTRLIRPAPTASVAGVPHSARSSAGMLDLCGSAGKQTGADFCQRRVLSMKKVYPNAKAALEGVLKDGMMIM